MLPLLELRGVGMAFGGLQVISDLDLHVDEGEIVSVIGPNGAPSPATSSSTGRASSAWRRTRSRTGGSHGRSRRCGCS